ncbi:hypothetical protein GCM10010435_29780 [Winogradskya consettensis]|uniref:DUF6817 domain-containing protein n=1 Tax=Winogradskya consettensis TaxID=113560 RepID=A0A919SF80_9ACTN|nr:hypothetical protein [Actinoplanes consettensis]GIM70715.1 hypothetical protein Aco04nite_21720 [Actinoplanes consettensis]
MDDIRAWLRARGTETVEHPGGTLYAHLNRVQERLGALGHDRDVQVAGLTHAAYSTDGFDLALVDHTDRGPLQALIGDLAEDLVHRYGSCERSRTWKTLPETRQVWDRWTDTAVPLPDGLVTPFADLSVINELDVLEQDPAIAARYGGYFRDLFAAWAPLLSAPVQAEVRRVLA